MKLLWSEKLKMNTVHVDDCARALVHLLGWYTADKKGGVFNLVDEGETGMVVSEASNGISDGLIYGRIDDSRGSEILKYTVITP